MSRGRVQLRRRDLHSPARLVASARVFALLILVSLGCSKRESQAVAVETKFAPDPPRMGREAVSITLRDANGRALSGAHVTAEGNMSHPGMAPVFGEAKEIGPGRYEASLDLGMRGSWVVLLHVRLADGEKIERQLAVDVKAD